MEFFFPFLNDFSNLFLLPKASPLSPALMQISILHNVFCRQNVTLWPCPKVEEKGPLSRGREMPFRQIFEKNWVLKCRTAHFFNREKFFSKNINHKHVL